MKGRPALLLALFGLLVAACGYTGPAEEEQEIEALPPGGRLVTEDEPLRVVMAGDSVMADLAPAVIDALEGGGQAEVRFLLVPGLAPDPALEALWEQELESFDPDLIAVLVGTWETLGASVPPGDPGWRRPYMRRVLEPYADLISAQGARVLWLGMPTVRGLDNSIRLAALNGAYAELAGRRDDVNYVDGAALLAGPSGEFRSILQDSTGRRVRVRRTDGLHLCPGGSVLLAEEVIDHAVAQWAVEVGPGWREGSWTEPPLLPDPAECPPVPN